MGCAPDNSPSLRELREELTRVLDVRDETFPRREPGNTDRMRDLMRQYATCLADHLPADWKPDAALVATARSVLDRPIFLCGQMKSGTTLLVELLDGHPELLVMPADSHLLALADRYRHRPFSELVDEAGPYWVHRFVSPKGQAPYWLLGEDASAWFDLLQYLRYWLEELRGADHAFFTAAALAYFCSNPQRPPTPRFWVEKTPGNELQIDRLLALFPTARFIHMVRDPRDNLASLRKLYDLRGWDWSAESVAWQLRESWERGLTARDRLGTDRYMILRYEDVLGDPEVSMAEVARFLGIAEAASLLLPTVNGMPAKANSMFRGGQVVGVINSARTPQWAEVLEPDELDTLTHVLYPTAAEFGYDLGRFRYHKARAIGYLRRLRIRGRTAGNGRKSHGEVG